MPLKVNLDRDALDDDALLFRREGGGWPRLNKRSAA
jgi:type I restriction enzyme, R subunit